MLADVRTAEMEEKQECFTVLSQKPGEDRIIMPRALAALHGSVSKDKRGPLNTERPGSRADINLHR